MTTFTLPEPTSGESFKIRAASGPVRIFDGQGEITLAEDEEAVFVACAEDVGGPEERHWWERRPAGCSH